MKPEVRMRARVMFKSGVRRSREIVVSFSHNFGNGSTI